MKVDKKLLLHHVIILAFMFGFKYLPTFSEMTEFGMAILGAFLGTIYGWLTVGFLVPSICGIFALGFSGAYETMQDCFAATFGSEYVPLMFGCLLIAALMQKLNLTDVLVGFLMNLGFAKKNMTVFFMMFFIATWVVSIFSDCFITIILFIEIYASMAKNAGIAPHSKVNSFVLCGIVLAGMVSNISLPFKSVAISIMGLAGEYTGIMMSFVDYIVYITSYQIILFILYTLIGRYVLRIDFSVFTAASIEKKNMDAQQKAGFLSLILMFIGFILTTSDTPLFPYLGLGGVGLGIVLFMLIFQIDGKPLLNLSDVAGKFDWGLFLMMAFFMEFIGYVGSPDVGLTATVKAVLAPMLSLLSPTALIIICILGTVLVSNALNNWPVVIIFISVMSVLVETVAGLNMQAAVLAISVAGYLAFATPAANPGSAIAYGYKDLIKPSEHIKVAGICSIILGLITAFVYYPLLCLVF